MLILNAVRKSPLNAHVDLFSGSSELNFGPSPQLHPYFVYTRHLRIQDFLSGGGGSRKQPGQRCLCFVFLVLNLFYSLQRGVGSNDFITEKTILFQGSRGGPTFSMGSNFFARGGGGPNASFYRNPYNVIFQGGDPDPIPPPLWIRTCEKRKSGETVAIVPKSRVVAH